MTSVHDQLAKHVENFEVLLLYCETKYHMSFKTHLGQLRL